MEMGFDSFRLAAATADLGVEPEARGTADCLEFRMDLAETPAETLAAYEGVTPLVVTNRPTWEGGEAADAGRLDALVDAIAHPAVAAVDIEQATVAAGDAAPVIEAARAAGCRLIVSAHEFEATPTTAAMVERLKTAGAVGDVAKLAVMAREPADSLALLAATQQATAAGIDVATMAMGEPGRHTRVIAPIYGSRIGYAPVAPGDATAPGQYDLETLSALVDAVS